MLNEAEMSARDAHEANARLFMILFLASWSIGFVALFMASIYLRLDAITWPPAHSPSPPRVLTGVSTVVTIASSLFYHWGLWSIERDRVRSLIGGLTWASGLMFVFLLIQLAAGFQATAQGLVWSSGVYASLFWIFAGFHYAHAIIGCTAGCWLLVRAVAGRYSSEHHLSIRLWGYYWHSVGVVWILIYIFIFLP